jgi:hypothetical protein
LRVLQTLKVHITMVFKGVLIDFGGTLVYIDEVKSKE